MKKKLLVVVFIAAALLFMVGLSIMVGEFVIDVND
jgi:hypothetical protein